MTALFAIAITIFLGGKIDLNYFESGENTCFATILATLTFAVFTFARILLPRKRRSDHEYRHKSEYLAKAQELIHQPLCIIDALLSSRALYLWFLKRAIRIQASPTQLMSFMFGPQGHWSKTAIYSVFMISLIASFGVFAPSGSRQQPNSLLYLSALIWVYTSIGITSKDWLQTRREQNLLLLTPHFPQGRKMNESMGDILVSSHNAKFAQLVIVFVAFFLINVSLKNTDRFQIVAGVETLLTVYLILLGLQFRSFAHLKSKPDFDLSAIFRALVIVVFTLSPVALSGIFFSVTTTCIVLLAYIFGGITFLIWRCRRMLDGPASLPAGRLADN